jgi:glycosyltransferase involved in cell wall biosynthesis
VRTKPFRNKLRLASVVPSTIAGGIGPVCLYAAKALAETTGWEVSLVCLHDKPQMSSAISSAFRQVNLGLESDCAAGFLQWLRRNPQDVIITNDVHHVEAAFPFLPSSTKHIVQLHDAGRRYRAVVKNALQFVDGVMCVSHHVESKIRKELEKYYYHGVVGTVHNGAAFPPLSGRRQHSNAEPFRLLFMGRFEPFKGIADLPRILRELRKLHVPVVLQMVGSEDAPGEELLLKRRMEAAGCSDTVIWRGRVPHEECYEMARMSDAFLMLSRSEAFGMVTIEAMSMGCIPLAYDMPSGTREIIEHGVSGFLEPLGDCKALARRVHELHNDAQLLRRISASAAEIARTRFNSETMATCAAEFVEQVVLNAERSPACREVGMPPCSGLRSERKLSGYRQLPLGFRRNVRRFVGARPRLCHWLLNL